MASITTLLYGWHRYTDVYSRQKKNMTGWAHNPAKNLIRLAEDLTRFPDLDYLLVDVWNDIILDSADPLDPVNSLSAPVCDFFGIIDQALSDHPGLHVSLIFMFPEICSCFIDHLTRF